MKDKITDIAKAELEAAQGKKISRKEAIKKAGFVALSAATMMMLVGSPNTAHGASNAPPTIPTWPGI